MRRLVLFSLLLLGVATYLDAARILNVHCISEIQARFAITDFLSSVQNDNAWGAEEVTYEMYLPERAFISSFSITIDSATTYGEIREKEAARLRYEQARANGEAAGNIEQLNDNLPRNTKKFLIKLNVPRSARVDFNMTYQELLQRELGVYKHIINVRPNQFVDDVQVDVLVAEKSQFRLLSETNSKIHVPQFRDDIGYLTNDQLLRMPGDSQIEVRTNEQPGGSLAYIFYAPNNNRPNGQVAILFDIERSNNNGGVIQTYDGYFLQSIAPENIPVGAKNVVFVLDKSGSMRGRKIAQVKKAMETILNQLDSADMFNVVLFSKDVQSWVDTLVPVNPNNIQQAKKLHSAG
jgi:hypothetical protein